MRWDCKEPFIWFEITYKDLLFLTVFNIVSQWILKFTTHI